MPNAASEDKRRINATIAKARACLMNDSKWREVFSLLGSSPHLRTPVRWRFVRDDRVFFDPVPPASWLLAKHLPDTLPSPYGPYREIDWIEIPAQHQVDRWVTHKNDLDALMTELRELGQLPLSRSDSAIRISGYEW